MGQGLATIGLATLDVEARPSDALPDSESTSFVDGPGHRRPEFAEQSRERRGAGAVQALWAEAVRIGLGPPA